MSITPTDVNLLWDAMRVLIRESGRAANECGLSGWRQWLHLTDVVRKRFHAVRQPRRVAPERVAVYLGVCRTLAGRAEGTLSALQDAKIGCRLRTGDPIKIA